MGRFWAWLKSIFMSTIKEADFAAACIELALQAAESVIKTDLNGDGKVTALHEIDDIAVEFGIKKLNRFLDRVATEGLDLIPADEIARYLSIARLVSFIANRFGGDKVPLFRLLESLVLAAFVKKTEVEVQADLTAKGIV